MSGAPPVAARGLVKRYGEITAVDGVDLTVERGDVFGYLGPNGAGKTTSLRMLLGLIRPTEGHARLFGRRFDHNGRRLGLTRAQCRTLGYLARNEGINQAGMADLLEIRPMTLVRQIDRMEEAGWIERRPDPADRRARRLFLTAKARPILGRIWNVANETRNEALARLSPGEAETLIGLLDRVHATLSERVPFGAARPAVLGAPRAPAAAAIAQAVPEAKVSAVESAR